MISAMFAAAALLASGPAAATPSTSPASAPAAPDKTKAEGRGDEMVCRTEQVLGTRFPKRICRTRSAIETDRDAERAEMNKVQREQRVRP